MEKSNTNIFRIPDNLENIDISKPYIPNKIVTISQEPIGNNQVSKPNHNTELDNVYSEIATIDMLWEGVYRKYISRFSDAYNSGNEYYIHCAGGYRSMITASILKSRGFEKLIDVAGGFNAIKETGISVTAYVCPSTL